VTPAAVEAVLMAREDLGSTGLGGGFALPHARIDGLRDYAGLFLRLAGAIDFAAIDGKLIDLAFVLLIPFDTKTPQVSVLVAIACWVGDTTVAAGLRTAKAPNLVFDLLTGVTKS
jgi:PTS system nitrogen regulatory IIA component